MLLGLKFTMWGDNCMKRKKIVILVVIIILIILLSIIVIFKKNIYNKKYSNEDIYILVKKA